LFGCSDTLDQNVELEAVRSAETTRCLLRLGASALEVSVRGETARDQFWDNSLWDIYFGYTFNFPTACTRERIIVHETCRTFFGAQVDRTHTG
jgi:hypothetical protein